jgi:hypothetical protein
VVGIALTSSWEVVVGILRRLVEPVMSEVLVYLRILRDALVMYREEVVSGDAGGSYSSVGDESSER